MRVSTVRRDLDGAKVRLSAAVDRPEGETSVYFEYVPPEPGFVTASADPFAAVLLLPAMRAGEPLEVLPSISPRLHTNLPRLRDIFRSWWPAITAPTEVRTSPGASLVTARPVRAGTFFSGGVDSFYTLLRNLRPDRPTPAPLTHLIFMRGVESRLDQTYGITTTEARIDEVADHVGVRVIKGQTDLRTTGQGSENNLHWERHFHGSALAAIGLGLSGGLSQVHIPSAFAYTHLVPHGSSPLTDEMYSTERTQIIHDGSEVGRAEKVRKIVEWDVDLILEHLRVCWDNSGSDYNCGRCGKCVRTAVPLYALGVWDRVKNYRTKERDHWESVLERDHLVLTEENLQLVRDVGGPPELEGMLDRIVQRRRKLQGRQLMERAHWRNPLERDHWIDPFA